MGAKYSQPCVFTFNYADTFTCHLRVFRRVELSLGVAPYLHLGACEISVGFSSGIPLNLQGGDKMIHSFNLSLNESICFIYQLHEIQVTYNVNCELETQKYIG